MRIAIVTIYPPETETGVSKVADLLCKNYSEKGHCVLYLCVGNKLDYFKKDKINFLTIPSIPVKQGFAPKLSPYEVRFVNKCLDEFKPDIIHAQNSVFTALVALVWSKKNNVPFIFTPHSQPTNIYKYLFSKKEKNSRLLKYTTSSNYLKRFIENSDLLISLNDSIKNSVSKITKNVKIKTLNNGLYLKDYFDLSTSKPGKNIYFLYLGMYMPRKNQEYLVDVFSHLPKNYKLLLHGNKKTGSKYVEILTKRKSELNAENVKIGNFIKGWSKKHTFQKASFFVSASTTEVQSLSIIEALASGTPVIGLANETLDELVNKDNGLVLTKNTTPKEFANKLQKFVEKNTVNYEHLSNSARVSVKKYDIEEVSNKLLLTYKKVISEKAKTTSSRNHEGIIPKVFSYAFQINQPNHEEVEEIKTKIRLNSYVYLTVLLAIITWPIFKSFRYIKSKI